MEEVINPNKDYKKILKEAFYVLQESRRVIAWTYPL